MSKGRDADVHPKSWRQHRFRRVLEMVEVDTRSIDTCPSYPVTPSTSLSGGLGRVASRRWMGVRCRPPPKKGAHARIGNLCPFFFFWGLFKFIFNLFVLSKFTRFGLGRLPLVRRLLMKLQLCRRGSGHLPQNKRHLTLPRNFSHYLFQNFVFRRKCKRFTCHIPWHTWDRDKNCILNIKIIKDLELDYWLFVIYN